YNRRAAELWGRTPSVGDKQQRYCGALKTFSVEGKELEGANLPMAALLRTRSPIRELELFIEHPCGSRNAILASLDPLFDDGGALVGGVSCFHDISERKAAEQRLRAREEWYLSVLEALPAAIYTTDADGHLTFFNQAAEDLAGHKPTLG